MLITCYHNNVIYNLRPNPTDYFRVCGEFVAEPIYRCNVTLNNSSWRKEFIATRKDHVFLYSPIKKKYVQYEYIIQTRHQPRHRHWP